MFSFLKKKNTQFQSLKCSLLQMQITGNIRINRTNADNNHILRMQMQIITLIYQNYYSHFADVDIAIIRICIFTIQLNL
jgi:hypothetical protein